MAITLGQLKELISRLESDGAVDSTKVYLTDKVAELWNINVQFAEVVSTEVLSLATIERFNIKENIIILDIPT